MARNYKAQGSTVVPVKSTGGLTPIYDTATGKWKYELDPDSTRILKSIGAATGAAGRRWSTLRARWSG